MNPLTISGIISVAICMGLPLVISLWLMERKDYALSSYISGFISYFLFYMIIFTSVAGYILPGMGWYMEFANSKPLYTIILTAFISSVLMIGGANILMARAKGDGRSLLGGLFFGLGVWAVESFIVTGTQSLNVLFYGAEAKMTAVQVLFAGVERLLFLPICVVFYMTVMQAVLKKNIYLTIEVVIIQAALSATLSLLVLSGTGLPLIMGLLFIFSLLCCFYLTRIFKLGGITVESLKK